MLGRLRRIPLTILCLLCAIHFVRYWILPGRDGLWIDEAGTFWTIAADWKGLWERTAIHPNSRIYGASLLAWTHLAGTSETALRLPSWLAALGAIAALSWFLRSRLGEGVVWTVAVAGLVSPEISFFGLDARPYAFAILFVVLSLIACSRVRREMNWRNAACWVVSAGLLVNTHPVVSLALCGQLAWLAWSVDWRDWTLRRAIGLAGMLAGLAAAAAPEAIRLRAILFGPNPSALPRGVSLVTELTPVFPPSIIGPAAVAALSLLALRRWRRTPLDDHARQVLGLGLATICAAAGLIAAYSQATGANLFLPRYLIAIYPGYILVLCALLAKWTDHCGRLWFAAIYAGATLAASVWFQGWAPHHADADWRGAMASVREWEAGRGAPLLLETGLVEGMREREFDDPKWSEFLVAPAVYYRHSGPTYALPYLTGPVHEPGVEAVLNRVGGTRFAAVVYAAEDNPSSYIRAIAELRGPPRLLGRFRRLEAYGFDPP